MNSLVSEPDVLHPSLVCIAVGARVKFVMAA